MQLPELRMLLLTAAKDSLRHLGPLGDGEGFRVPATDRRRPAEGAFESLMMNIYARALQESDRKAADAIENLLSKEA